jgi:D-alanyl-D-alanine carboxypeptidase (penicillin-binding protein 5/6)
MRALGAIQFSPPLDLPVKAGQDAADMNTNGDSVAGLRPGDTMTLRKALYALLLPSGDDAVVPIADAVAGSQERFVGLMNLEAALLGMRHTRDVNRPATSSAAGPRAREPDRQIAWGALARKTSARRAPTRALGHARSRRSPCGRLIRKHFSPPAASPY